MNLKYSIYLFVLAIIWGWSFAFIKIATYDFSSVPLAMTRIGLAALFLILICACLGRLKSIVHLFFNKQYIIHLILAGLFGQLIPFILIAYAEHQISASNAAILNATTPIWTAIIAICWLKRKFSALQIFGIALGFTGVFILMTDYQISGSETPFNTVGAMLLATLCYAAGANYLKRFLNDCHHLEVATISTIYAALIGLPFAIFLWPQNPISYQAWQAAIILGVICTGLAYILFFELISKVDATTAASVTFLVPIFGVIWGVYFLDEPLTTRMIISILIIISSIFMTNHSKKTASV